MSSLDPLVEVLSFHTAIRNYGFVDRLSNALDEITAYEAVRDALRDFYSQCVDRQDRCIEIRRGEKILCPEVKTEDLEKAVSDFIKRIRGRSGDEIVRETRELALVALARKPKLTEKRC